MLLVLALAQGVFSGCRSDLSVPASSVISCRTDNDCPEPQQCNRALGQCQTTLANVPPQLALSVPSRGVGLVSIALTIADPNGAPYGTELVDVSFSWSVGDMSCLIAAIADATTQLEATREGTLYTFTWDAAADAVGTCGLAGRAADRDGDEVGDATVVAWTSEVTLHATATDREGATSTTAATLALGNDPPVVTMALDPGGKGGDVAIPFSVVDASLDVSGVELWFSLPEAPNDWRLATIKYGATDDLPSDGRELLLVWDSLHPTGGVGFRNVQGVTLRLRAYDGDADLDFGPYDVHTIDVTNQSGPTAEQLSVRVGAPGRATGVAYIEYTLVDDQSDLADVRVEFSVDGGQTFSPCSELPVELHGGRYRLSTSPRAQDGTGGRRHTFAWDVLADLHGESVPSVMVRVTPADAPGGVGVAALALVEGGLGLPPVIGGTAGYVAGPATDGAPSEGLLLADVNGDGVPDAVTGNFNGSADLLVFAGAGLDGTGAGSFGAPSSYDPGSMVTVSFGTGRLDTDGRQDVALLTDAALYVYLGASPVTYAQTVAGCAPRSGRLALGDFDDDGYGDVAAACNSVRLYAGSGAGLAVDTNAYSGAGVLRVGAGDVNGDGFDDLVVARSTSHQVFEVLLYAGQARSAPTEPFFGPPAQVDAGLGYYFEDDATVLAESGLDVSIADLDLDGFGEVIVLSTPFLASSVLDVYPGGPTLAAPVSSDILPTRARYARAADANGDGDLEVFSFLCDASPSICITIHDPRPGADQLSQLASFELPSHPCANARWQGDATDLNGDGLADIAIAQRCSSPPGSLRAWLAGEGGELAPLADQTTLVHIPESADIMALHDNDRDGVTDSTVIRRAQELVFATRGRATPPYINTAMSPWGAGGFSVFAPSTVYFQHAFGDINRDGVLDVYLSNFDTERLYALVASVDSGGWALAAPVDLGIGWQGLLFAADLDGDGFDDAVGRDGSTLRVGLSSQAGGTWQSAVTLPTPFSLGFGPSVGTAADFDGDGILDVAVVSTTTSLAILRGQGNGTFTSFCSVTLAGTRRAITVADINRNGHPDVVIAYAVAAGVTGLQAQPMSASGCAGGLATLAADNQVAVELTSLGAADLNGDGVTDLYGVGSGRVVSWRGRAVAGIPSGTLAPAVDLGVDDVRLAEVDDLDRDGVTDLVVATSAGELVFVRGQRQAIFDAWSQPLSPAALQGSVLPSGVDAFGEPFEARLLVRPYSDRVLYSATPMQDFVQGLRRSGLANATIASTPITTPTEVRGMRRVRPLGDRWEVTSALGVDAQNNVVALDAQANPPRAVIVDIPIALLATLLDLSPSGTPSFLFARYDDLLRASQSPGDPLFGSPAGDSVLPLHASAEGPHLQRTYEWAEIPRDPDEDLSTPDGPAYVIDESDGQPVLRVALDREGVLQLFLP